MKNDFLKSLPKKKKQLIELWMKNQLADPALREDLMSNDELRLQSEELVDTLLRVLNDATLENPDAPELEPLYEILGGISLTRAKHGYSPRETGAYIFSLKWALIDIISQDAKGDVLSDVIRLNKFIDNLSVISFETFIKGREEVILRQTDEISEISTPVIRVWDGILALPIIGTLDSSRTQIVMESLLTAIVDTSSSIAILDISGVPTVDSLVAQHLIKTVSATRLMGADCVISGIRPEIAQTIVHLGIDLSTIVTKASLSAALRYAFDSLRLEVVKKSAKQSTQF